MPTISSPPPEASGNKPRAIKDGPFCWQDKRTLRRIREDVENPAVPLLVYHALTEKASNVARETFTTTHAHLAGMCGLGLRSIRYALKDLKEAGFVVWTTLKIKAPCTYTLTAFSESKHQQRPLNKELHTVHINKQRAAYNDRGSVQPLEEREESNTTTTPRRFKKPSLEEVTAKAKAIGLPESEAEAFLDYNEARGWMMGRTQMKSWPHALVIWKKNVKPHEKHKITGHRPNRNDGIASNPEVIGRKTEALVAQQNESAA